MFSKSFGFCTLLFEPSSDVNLRLLEAAKKFALCYACVVEAIFTFFTMVFGTCINSKSLFRKSGDLTYDDCIVGMEFSGFDSTRNRIMGVLPRQVRIFASTLPSVSKLAAIKERISFLANIRQKIKDAFGSSNLNCLIFLVRT